MGEVMGNFPTHFFRNPARFVLAGTLLAVVLVAVLANWIVPYDPLDVQLKSKLKPPGLEHWMGTDNLGRDVFSRLVAGTRISLGAGVLVLLLSVSSGTVLGVVSGYAGGVMDELLMRVADIFLAFPALILALAITAVLGPNLTNAMVAISISWWPWYARLVRGMVMTVKENDYVLAARCVGATRWRIALIHIIPNLITPVVVQASMDMGAALVTASSLSFIGLGVQPPVPEWGAMISQGRGYVFAAWWMGTFPGLAIFGTVYLFNSLGDAINVTLTRRILA
jgi:peptide/nickel transport system permease protein